MRITPAMLRAIGQANYGPNWLGPVGKDLNVGDRTMRDWQNDDAQIPPGIAGELVELCCRRSKMLADLAQAIASGDLEGILGRGAHPKR